MDKYGNERVKEALQRQFFKAKVALRAIGGEKTLAELVANHGVHCTMSAA